jgi:hypothetical protein
MVRITHCAYRRGFRTGFRPSKKVAIVRVFARLHSSKGIASIKLPPVRVPKLVLSPREIFSLRGSSHPASYIVYDKELFDALRGIASA